MRCQVTYSSRDLHGNDATLLGLNQCYCFVILEGDVAWSVLPIEAIDWAGLRAGEFRDSRPGEAKR
jgi:hypothetical protein